MIGENDDGQTILQFGEGDIGIYHKCDKKGIGLMTFENIPSHEIGKGITVKHLFSDIPVVMEFSNTKSIDVIIDDLKDIKIDMSLKCLKSSLKE